MAKRRAPGTALARAEPAPQPPAPPDPDQPPEPERAALLGSEVTRAHKELFLTAFAKTGIIAAAATAARVARNTVYWWKDTDTEFARRLTAEAMPQAVEVLELAAWTRAVVGVKSVKRNYDRQGGLISEETETKYSDGLMTLLLKAHAPGKYADIQRHTGADGEGPVDVVFEVAIRRPLQDDDAA